MEQIRHSLSILPPWLFSLITLIAICWLTLSPKPLGENPPALFPGADKLAHGLMFGGFVAMILLDWQRKHQWQKIPLKFALFCSVVSTLLGIIIEYAQANMHLGRGFEYPDMLADTVGAFSVGLIWVFLQKFWIN